ncbi:putative oxidoreductase SA2266 [Microbulbifer sp. NBRC 101763]|uniref:SDR family NAD(P)-dependent oxidoreductase n=1 Tax=unclassified Microbulbifer TaxID=2619833 RepID=UPI0024AD78C7|nr:SDR family NAD(P)-dependent oxidoreductase [Microbulbifer sp. MLAF003]WHI53299.1 SDR family NAD(P)-dependent oxidoreductase [Microbulbifer sp. MLAF003]
MAKHTCVVVGVGPGNGAAFAKKFNHEGYQVALLARNKSYLDKLQAELRQAKSYICDVTKPDQIADVFSRIQAEMAPIETLIYNAGSGHSCTIENLDIYEYESDWKINCRGCALFGQLVTTEMIQHGKGNIIIVGATASLRGGANFASFASAKAAQRSLAQSMARHLWPKGVHVAYLIIDGPVSKSRTLDGSTRDNQTFLQPPDIADTAFFLTTQAKSAWTFEVDLRPHVEKW